MAISEAIAFIVLFFSNKKKKKSHLQLGKRSKVEILTKVSVSYGIQKVYCRPLLSHDQLVQKAVMFIEPLDLETLSTVPC